jgi:malonyl-CoA O-methyltransferase
MVLIPFDSSLYAQRSVLAQTVGKEMIARLAWMTLQPQVILDVGCATGELTRQLQDHFPTAKVMGIDIAESMLAYAQANHSDIVAWVCSDGASLPLPDRSVNFIYANFLLPWHRDVKRLLREWRRVLQPEGLLILSALGPDTLQEVKRFLLPEEMPHCVDMHDVGDMLLSEGWSDPVLDVDHYTLAYSSQKQYMDELQAAQLWFPQDTAQALERLKALTPDEEGHWLATFEVIYAHAFAPPAAEQAMTKEGVTKIPLSLVRNQLLK